MILEGREQLEHYYALFLKVALDSGKLSLKLWFLYSLIIHRLKESTMQLAKLEYILEGFQDVIEI